jgi:glycosyltransferase involved in cell wall biosynthesis
MFSVVIPLYNKAHTISDTLKSVLSQTFTEFEVVIIDDGSTDHGPDRVADEFSDPRIRLIHQTHQGASAARNRGVAAASYELIAFLDADDIFLPRYLEEMHRAVTQFPDAGMYCCAGFTLYPDGSGYLRTSRRFGTAPRVVRYFTNPNFFGNCSSTIVRKFEFSRCGGFPVGMTHSEDDVLFFKVALQNSVVFCPIPLTVYRQGIDGQTSSEVGVYSNELAIDKINLVYRYWLSLEPRDRDPLFPAFAITSLRYALTGLVKTGTSDEIDHFFERVDPELRLRFTETELTSGKGSWSRSVALLSIFFRKLVRRLRFLPRERYLTRLPIVMELHSGSRCPQPEEK